MNEALDRERDVVAMDRDDPDAEIVASRADENRSQILHRIVVVGGGAAGLELVTKLGDRVRRRGRASVTLVECVRTRLWKPLLHAVAAGSLDPGEYEVNYLAQAHWLGFRYRFGEMIGLDRVAKQVHGDIAAARWARDQSHQSARRRADAADDARSRHFRDRGLRRLSASRHIRAGAASRAGRTPGSIAPDSSDRASAPEQALAAIYLPRLRLTGFARQMEHSRQPDGIPVPPQHLRRRPVCPDHVSLASSYARAGAGRHVAGCTVIHLPRPGAPN
jgi:hypothetical protein